MPILPDITKEYNINLGKQVDTSGAEGDAAVYGALSNVSAQMGQFAAKVSDDLYRQSSQLEASEKLQNYKAQSAQFVEDLKNNPDLDFVNNGDEIQKMFFDRNKKLRETMIDKSQTSMSQELMQQGLAGGEADDAINFIALKDKKIKEAMIAHQSKIENSFSVQYDRMDGDYTKTNIAYKNAMNEHEMAFRGYLTPDKAQKMATDLADKGAIGTTTIMLARGRTVEAALQFLGKNANTLKDHINLNYKNGVDTYSGIGFKDPNRAGFYSVQMADGNVISVKEPMELWNKSSIILSKEYTKMSQSTPIDNGATNDMLNNLSPETRNSIMSRLLSAMTSRPKEDDSLQKKQLASALISSSKGELSNEGFSQLMSSININTLNKAGLTDLYSVIISKSMQDVINQIPEEKLSRQDDMIKEVDRLFPDVAKGISNNPQYSKIFEVLGEGDIEKGKLLATEELSTKKQRDKLIEFAEKRSIKLKSDIEKDPVDVARRTVQVIPQLKALEDRLFTEGKLSEDNPFTQQEASLYRNQIEKEQAKVNSLVDNFGSKPLVLNKDRIAQFKTLFESSFSETGKTAKLMANAKLLYSPEQFATIMEQIDRTSFAQALNTNNLSSINELIRSEKYYNDRIKVSSKEIGDTMKDFFEDVNTNDTLNDYINSIQLYSNSSQPKIAASTKEAVQKLALMYKNERGLDNKDAIATAVNTLVGNDNIIVKNKWFGANYNLILPKNSKIESSDLDNVLDATLNNEAWLTSQNLVIPPEVKKDYEALGVEGYSRFIQYIKKNATARNSANGNGYDLGFTDENKKFIPLIDNDGKRIAFTLDAIKQGVAKQKQEESKNFKWWNPMSYIDDTAKNKMIKSVTEFSRDRSTAHFVNNIGNEEVKTLQHWENPQMDTQYNRIINGALGAALKPKALMDAVDILKIKLPSGVNEGNVLDYFSKNIKSKSEYDILFAAYMKRNRQYLDDGGALKGQTNAGKNIIADVGWGIGASRIISSGIPQLIRDGKAQEALNKLNTYPEFRKNYPINGIRYKAITQWLRAI